MTHDRRILRHEEQIEILQRQMPAWIKDLPRPATPAIIPPSSPLAGIRVVSTGIIVAQPYIGTKMAEFGAEVIHVERPGGDPYRGMAPLLTRGPREHSCDEAKITKNKLSLGLDLKHAQGRELLMALWKISDVWMEASAPGTLERAGLSNELALAVNPRLVIVRVSTYGQFGQEDYLGCPGYDALAQAYGGMMAITGDPSGPPQRAKVYTGDYLTSLTGWAATMMGLWEVRNTGRGQVIDLAQYEAVMAWAGALGCGRQLYLHGRADVSLGAHCSNAGHWRNHWGSASSMLCGVEQRIHRDVCRRLGDWDCGMSGESGALARSGQYNGYLAQACELASQALTISQAIKFLLGVGLAQHALARIAQSEGAFADAEQYLHEAQQTYATIQSRYWMARTHLDQAILAHPQGHPEAAARHLQEAQTTFTALQLPKYVEHTEHLAEACGVSLAKD